MMQSFPDIDNRHALGYAQFGGNLSSFQADAGGICSCVSTASETSAGTAAFVVPSGGWRDLLVCEHGQRDLGRYRDTPAASAATFASINRSAFIN